MTSRWGVLVLVALSNGTMRWGEIRRWVKGVTEKMLAQTLRTVEADGLVAREAYPVVPPRVDYSLTGRGRELTALLLPLVDWSPPTRPAESPKPHLRAAVRSRSRRTILLRAR